MHLLVVVIFLLLVLRIFYRTWLNFPPSFGPSLLQADETGELMDEGRFWNFIERSRQVSNGNYDRQVEALTDLLEGERLTDIVAFQRTFVALHNCANHFKYWECAYALNWGCSDDGFDYFRTWWIAQGKNKTAPVRHTKTSRSAKCHGMTSSTPTPGAACSAKVWQSSNTPVSRCWRGERLPAVSSLDCVSHLQESLRCLVAIHAAHFAGPREPPRRHAE